MASVIEQALANHPRVRLAHLPTPLEAMDNLSKKLGGPRLYVKRDDCTGVAMGGNKARQAEFYFGKAVVEGVDTIITTGAFQSNHVRMTCAYARKLGMECEIQLEHRVAGKGGTYLNSGNVLLDRLFGARIHEYPDGEDEAGADRNLGKIADDVRAAGWQAICHSARGRASADGGLGLCRSGRRATGSGSGDGRGSRDGCSAVGQRLDPCRSARRAASVGKCCAGARCLRAPRRGGTGTPRVETNPRDAGARRSLRGK